MVFVLKRGLQTLLMNTLLGEKLRAVAWIPEKEKNRQNRLKHQNPRQNKLKLLA